MILNILAAAGGLGGLVVLLTLAYKFGKNRRTGGKIRILGIKNYALRIKNKK